MFSVDEAEGNPREGSLCGVLRESIHWNRRNHPIEVLVILDEAVVDAGGSYRERGKDDDDKAYVAAAAAARGLDIFSRFLWNTVHDHQVDPLEIHTVTDHVGRNNGVKES